MIWKKCYQLLFCLLLSGLLPTAQTQASETKTGVATTPAGRVLFVMSSQKFHGNSTLPASISFGEVVHAWDTFHNAGYVIDFVSPAGGAVPAATYQAPVTRQTTSPTSSHISSDLPSGPMVTPTGRP